MTRVLAAIILLMLSVLPAVGAEKHVRVRILEKYHPQIINVQYDESIYEYETINLKSEFPAKFPLSTRYKITIPKTGLERFYTGTLKIQKKDNELLIINVVPVESYVASVVLSEMGMAPPEAMCAQAVISRTWAVDNIHMDKHYDFNDLTSGQSYQGWSFYVVKARQIISGTEGEVLTFNGEIAKILYHAQCSDRLFSAYEIWGGKKLPYLSGGPLPPETNKRGRSNLWETEIPIKQLDDILSGGARRPDYYKIERRNGRLMVNTGSVKIGIDTFRLAVNRKLGWNTLRSNDFEILIKGENLLFKGKGFGHLVGLCQEGAGTLAESGWKYHDILSLFYTGCIIEKID